MYTPVKSRAGQGIEREERLFQILAVMLWLEYECGDGNGRLNTLREIGKIVHLVPSKHFRDLMVELAERGWVEIYEGLAPNGTTRYEYRLNDRTVPHHPRHEELWASALHKSGEPCP